MANVKDFICAELKNPFVWGWTDCCAMADRWVQEVCGFSPLAKYGRKHVAEMDAQAWLNEPGGIVKAVWRVMRRAGFKRTTVPREGDVGLCIAGQDRICTAIFNGHHWVSRDASGWILSDKTLLAWRVV